MKIIVAFLMMLPMWLNAASYSTSFPLNENPISEGGKWIGGLTVGLDWSNVVTSGGHAIAQMNESGGPVYSDSTALLTGVPIGPNQTVSCTLFRGAIVNGDFPEVEIRLRSNLSAHTSTGYEIDCGITTDNTGAYVAIVRWNGALGNFTGLGSIHSLAFAALGTGTIYTATAIGSTISVYTNGVLALSAVDSTWPTGSVGVGFDTIGPASNNALWGWSSFTASDTATVSTNTTIVGTMQMTGNVTIAN